MTTSKFYSPTAYSQVGTVNDVTQWASLPWQNVVDLSATPAYTEVGLYTVSGMWYQKFYTSTNQLWCTGFNIPVQGTTVQGIELQLFVTREARIQDSVIQLTHNGELIGDNYAILAPILSDVNTGQVVTPIQTPDFNIYGGPADLWGAQLTPNMLSDASFGIVIAFSSNPSIPHRDIPFLSQVGLRITYA